MSLKDCALKISYRTLEDDVINGFYIPTLSQAVLYKRAVGFFSSSALVEISKGISYLVQNNGKIQIIASPLLQDEDIDAIQKGYELRNNIIKKSLFRNLFDYHQEPFAKERLNLLANLIAEQVLDIRIACPNNQHGIYHEKIGIIEDVYKDRIAFVGSMNETATGMINNFESFDVYCSWKNAGEQERVNKKNTDFDKIWNNEQQYITVVDFPELKEEIIRKYKISSFNDKHDFIEYENNLKAEHSMIHEYPNSNKSIIPKIPDEPALYDYQQEAISNWVSNNYCGIFDMATGTGKTYTGLGAIVKLSEYLDNKLAVIIVCPYQHLVEQWVDDIKKFNINPIIGHSGSLQKDWKKKLEDAIRNQKLLDSKSFFCFICTNATFRNDYVQTQIKKIKEDILLVVDEAHNIGASSYMILLDEKYKYRLALSATLDRHRDDDGTLFLYNYFGKKCIEYDLERAIKEGKLTPYNYHPILVYLTENERSEYENLSSEIAKNIIIGKNGVKKLNKLGELLAIQRSRLIAGASQKLVKLEKHIQEYQKDNFILVYCGATNISSDYYMQDNMFQKADKETTHFGIRQIRAVAKILEDSNMVVTQFTSEEPMSQRKSIISDFQKGSDLQALVAIKCLDEGVNIPSIKTAFILASSTNPKEYIQRRGRVLRKFPNKYEANIYDFVTLPRPLDACIDVPKEQLKYDISLIKNELTRMKEFGRLSQNNMKTEEIISKICDCYKLPYDLNFEYIGEYDG